MPLLPAPVRQRQEGLCVSLRPAWSAERGPGQPEIHSEIPSPKAAILSHGEQSDAYRLRAQTALAEGEFGSQHP